MHTSSKYTPTPAEELFHLFGHCARLIGRGHPDRPGHPEGPDERRDRPMHPGQGRALAALTQNGGSMSQSDLLVLLDIRSSSLSELLGKLERNGFIARQKDEQDKRVTIVTLTEAGQALVDTQMASRKERAQSVFAALDEAEQAQLLTLLTKLVEDWKAQLGADCPLGPRRRHGGPHPHPHPGPHNHPGCGSHHHRPAMCPWQSIFTGCSLRNPGEALDPPEPH